jgi:hypothetical protein
MLNELATALKEVLEQAFAHPRYINDRAPDQMAGVRVHVGQLPFKRDASDMNDFPFLLIQPVEGADKARGSEATVRIHCGVFNDESGNQPAAGANDLMNMVDRLRRTVRALHFIGDRNQYELNLPVTWRLGNSDNEHFQPLPMNEAVVTTTWNLPATSDVPGGQVQAALGMV